MATRGKLWWLVGMLSGLMVAVWSTLPLRAAISGSGPDTWKTVVTGKDIQAIVKLYGDRLGDMTKSQGLFGRSKEQVRGIGFAIATLGNMGTARYTKGREFWYAGLRETGLELAGAAAAADFAKVQEAVKKIQGFPRDLPPSPNAALAAWGDAFPLKDMMLFVQTARNSLQEAAGVAKPAELKAKGPTLAIEARMLAVLMVSLHDNQEWSQDDADWQKLSEDSMKGYLEVAKAAEAGSAAEIAAAMGKVNNLCNDCHGKFRGQ